MTGIYKITNKENGKIYIGQSIDILRRWKEHIKRGEFVSIEEDEFHYLLNKHTNSFTFEILEFCSIEDLDEKEIKYISLFNSFENGYNRTSGGNHCEQLRIKTIKPYILENGTVICPDEYLNKPLTREDKENLCKLIRLPDKTGRLLKWNSIKKKLIESGYNIKQKRSGTKNFDVISLTTKNV